MRDVLFLPMREEKGVLMRYLYNPSVFCICKEGKPRWYWA